MLLTAIASPFAPMLIRSAPAIYTAVDNMEKLNNPQERGQLYHEVQRELEQHWDRESADFLLELLDRIDEGSEIGPEEDILKKLFFASWGSSPDYSKIRNQWKTYDTQQARASFKQRQAEKFHNSLLNTFVSPDILFQAVDAGVSDVAFNGFVLDDEYVQTLADAEIARSQQVQQIYGLYPELKEVDQLVLLDLQSIFFNETDFSPNIFTGYREDPTVFFDLLDQLNNYNPDSTTGARLPQYIRFILDRMQALGYYSQSSMSDRLSIFYCYAYYGEYFANDDSATQASSFLLDNRLSGSLEPAVTRFFPQNGNLTEADQKALENFVKVAHLFPDLSARDYYEISHLLSNNIVIHLLETSALSVSDLVTTYFEMRESDPSENNQEIRQKMLVWLALYVQVADVVNFEDWKNSSVAQLDRVSIDWFNYYFRRLNIPAGAEFDSFVNELLAYSKEISESYGIDQKFSEGVLLNLVDPTINQIDWNYTLQESVLFIDDFVKKYGVFFSSDRAAVAYYVQAVLYFREHGYTSKTEVHERVLQSAADFEQYLGIPDFIQLNFQWLLASYQLALESSLNKELIESVTTLAATYPNTFDVLTFNQGRDVLEFLIAEVDPTSIGISTEPITIDVQIPENSVVTSLGWSYFISEDTSGLIEGAIQKVDGQYVQVQENQDYFNNPDNFAKMILLSGPNGTRVTSIQDLIPESDAESSASFLDTILNVLSENEISTAIVVNPYFKPETQDAFLDAALLSRLRGTFVVITTSGRVYYMRHDDFVRKIDSDQLYKSLQEYLGEDFVLLMADPGHQDEISINGGIFVTSDLDEGATHKVKLSFIQNK